MLCWQRTTVNIQTWDLYQTDLHFLKHGLIQCCHCDTCHWALFIPPPPSCLLTRHLPLLPLSVISTLDLVSWTPEVQMSLIHITPLFLSSSLLPALSNLKPSITKTSPSSTMLASHWRWICHNNRPFSQVYVTVTNCFVFIVKHLKQQQQ